MSQLYYRRKDPSCYRDRIPLRVVRAEAELSAQEKAYLSAVERGDYGSVKRALEEAEIYFKININCVDPLGRTALLIAIENVGDALLHAIRKEVVGAVELLLNHKKPSGEKQVSAGSCRVCELTSGWFSVLVLENLENLLLHILMFSHSY